MTALAICGCQVREGSEFAPEGKVFTATMEAFIDDASSVDTKTSLDAGGSVLWKMGDQVSIFAGSTINEHYQVTDASDGKTAAALNRVESPGFVAGGDIDNNVAFYPYAETAELAKNGSTYVIRDIALPAIQTYAQASFGNGAFPMTAVTSSTRDNNLKFKNVLGGLKLQLKGTATIASISITGNNNEVLCGDAVVDVTTASAPSISLTDASAKTVILDCGNGVQLNETTATAFIIALPPMTMTGGFTVTVTDTEGATMEIKTTKTQTITRSNLLSMPAVTYEGTTPAPEHQYIDPGLQSRASDSLALVAIYNAADGASWKEDRVWDLTKSMDEWYGVTLNADGRVSALKILANTIEKEWTMPAEIGNLTELTDLRFNSACVSGNFVESLYKLTKLVSLYFQINNISGSFSEKVTSWPNIKDIYINNNPNFGGTLPKELGQLKALRNINIAGTDVGGDVPAELSGCDALFNLMFHNTKLTSLPDNFDQWPSLRLIQAYNIPTLTGPLPASIGNCKNVTSVWIFSCNFEGNIPESWANLPTTCTQVRVQNNKLSGQVPAAVKAHSNWASKWKPAQYILPQQDGYGLTE